MSKRTTVLSAFDDLTAIPADVDFVVDGDNAEILVDISALVGSSPDINADIVQLDEAFDLPYDALTQAFTVGANVEGRDSHARGTIIEDDGTTLRLKRVSGGKFKDNEIVSESLSLASPGSATVNSAAGGAKTFVELGDWVAINFTAAGQTRGVFADPDAVTGQENSLPVSPRRFRLNWTLNSGSITDLDGHVSLTVSGL